MLISRLAVYAIIVVCLTGCSGMTAAHLSDISNDNQVAQKDEREKLWRDNKGWLLSKLPKTKPLVRDILSALQENPDATSSCSDSSESGCAKLLNLLRQKMSQYRLVQPPDGFESFAIMDDDAAYVFRMTDWQFSGIASLTTGLYFTAPDVPLRRTDERSFAFVADNKTDTETVWTMYRRNILQKDRSPSTLGEYSLTRAELDSAGVPKQIDQLTLQQRYERELAKQGMAWRRRAQMKAITMCSCKSDQGNKSRNPDGHGGRGKHNRTTSPDSTTAVSTPAAATTMAEALQGKAHLNCSAGSGYVVTEEGIAAEVYRLTSNKEGTDAIIAATAKGIPGGFILFKYPVERVSTDILNPDAGRDLTLQIETMDGGNKLILNLRVDTGVSPGSLILAGDWYRGSGYRFGGKDISNAEFTTFFIRAFRDCAMKDSQGICKNIPDLFMSLQNPLILEEFVQYISGHYLNDSKKNH
jgi:hypothetical protein